MLATKILKCVLPQINLTASFKNTRHFFPNLPRTTEKKVGTKIWRPMILPEPGKGGKAFRRIVHYKDRSKHY